MPVYLPGRCSVIVKQGLEKGYTGPALIGIVDFLLPHHINPNPA